MIDLTQYGCSETLTPAAGLLPGRVTELQREQYTLITERGEITAKLKGSLYHGAEARADFPSVGDFVLLQYNPDGASLITALLPRRSKFSRADFSGHAVGYVKTILEQVVAANFDYVFIVSSLNQDFNPGRIQRYLTQARQSGGAPVVILTKADLSPAFAEQVQALRQAELHIPIHAVSSYTGLGLTALDIYLQPCKTIVFLGMSGVGKSSLLNVLMGREVMDVRAIREADSRGRHTTTHRQLFMLPCGAMVIDTPGMRELGLFAADEGICAGFAYVENLFLHCRFSDCRHETEPGCAVFAALENGALSKDRWAAYLAQRRENRFVDSKANYLTNKHARQRATAMQNKKTKAKRDDFI